MTETTSTSFIVAGVDGSDSSADALRWAAEQARLTGAGLHAVYVWDFPSAYGWAWAPGFTGVDLETESRKDLDAMIHRVFDGDADVPLVARVERGNAAEVLVDVSRGADLLVVGSRGRGAFADMVLGSVSLHCAQHAACPVVIIRHRNH
ncbi:nucleotide-binding universal stress UspA family protein [Catenulispora sp. MAP12-49]|uniref:universal stress protein n=1 Tax=Catenulispora sp. MAP12-49 TaxID=3156302 RepID=UPI0035160E56